METRRGREMPARRLLVFALWTSTRWMLKLLPPSLHSSHFSRAHSSPQPLSLSFQVPATEASHHWISSLLPSCPGRISQQSNQWSNSWYLETDIAITSTQQHTLVLEVDYDLVFSRVMCIFLWIKVKCKLGGCYETLLLHCTILAILPKTIFHKGWLVSKCTGLNCIIKLII